jgi:hypothetical protein
MLFVLGKVLGTHVLDFFKFLIILFINSIVIGVHLLGLCVHKAFELLYFAPNMQTHLVFDVSDL